MITKKICARLSFQSFLCTKNFFLTKIIFIQEAFKNIQGLFKGIPQLFNFQGLFKAHALWKQFLHANEMKMYT